MPTEAAQPINRDRREALLLRLERLTEVPLLILSFLMIPLILGPYIFELTPGEERVFNDLDYMVWGIFAADMLTKVAIAPDKRRYLRVNWLEAISVAVPFFRPLRIVRVVVFGLRAYRHTRRLAAPDFLLAYAMGVVVICSTIVLAVEQDAPGGNIKNYGDAVWWAFTTVFTVGYGDRFPVTGIGRGVGVLLMVAGIALFSAVAANLAAFFVKSDRGDDRSRKDADDLADEVRRLRAEVETLRRPGGGQA